MRKKIFRILASSMSKYIWGFKPSLVNWAFRVLEVSLNIVYRGDSINYALKHLISILEDLVITFKTPTTLCRRNLKTQQSTVILDLRLRKLGQRNHNCLSSCHRFRKAPFLKCFPSNLKRKAGVFKFLQFEKGFRRLAKL